MITGKRGTTSVFLMLTLVSMLLVIAILTEAVSGAAARSYGMAVLELAGRSTLSNYNCYLKEQYGLFGMNMDAEAIKEEVLYYCEETLQQDTQDGDFMNLLDIRLKGVEIECDEFSLTNCEIFEQQLVDYMKYRALGDVLTDFNGSDAERNLEEQQKSVNKLFQEKDELSNVTVLMKKIKPIYSQYETVLQETKKLERDWKRWQKIKRLETEDSVKKAMTLKKRLQRKWRKIQKNVKFIQQSIEETREFYGQGEGFGNSGKTMIDKLRGVDKEIRIFLEIDVENLDVAFSKLHKEEAGQKERISLKQRIKGYQELRFGSQSDFSNKNSQGERKGWLRNDAVKNQLPSVLMGETNWSFTDMDVFCDKKKLLIEMKNQFLVNQYIFHKFATSLTQEREEETFFNNEVEYLLFGRFQDQENKTKAKHSIFALRTASNLLYLYGSAEKQEQLAIAATSLTPGPGSVVTQFLLASLWSCAEANNDLKIILNGGRIPFFKSEKSWALSLNSVLSGAGMKTVDLDLTLGMKYEDYLNLFLFLSPRQTILLRMMDLIQINLQGRMDGGFLLCNCKGGFLLKGELWKQSIFGESKIGGVIRKGKVVMRHGY